MKSLKINLRIFLLLVLVFPLTANSQSESALSTTDIEAIHDLGSKYYDMLDTCDAEGYADLFVPVTGFFSSGFRGRMAGRDRIVALVESERHCDVPPGSTPAARIGGSNRPAAIIEITADGARGIIDLGTAQYQDEYAKTPQGWRFAGRTVVIEPEIEIGIDAVEMAAIHALIGPDFVDYYLPNTQGIDILKTTGVSINIVEGKITGRVFVDGGGHYDDVYEKLESGQWIIKSRAYVAVDGAGA